MVRTQGARRQRLASADGPPPLLAAHLPALALPPRLSPGHLQAEARWLFFCDRPHQRPLAAGAVAARPPALLWWRWMFGKEARSGRRPARSSSREVRSGLQGGQKQ
jgi:hypothetical protein